MSRFVVRGAFVLAIAAFIWSSDPLLGFLVAICALVWALMPLAAGPTGSGMRLHDRLYLE